MKPPNLSELKEHLQDIRPLVLGALILSFTGMILSFLALFAGNTVSDLTRPFMGYAPVIRYDTSIFSATGSVQHEGTQTSISILSVCTTTPASPSPLCTPTRRGSPDPSDPPFQTTGTVLLVTLTTQLAASSLAVTILPWLLIGRIHLNGILPPLLLIGWLAGFTAASTGSAFSLAQTHVAIPARAPISYSPVWIALLWSAQACVLAAAALEHVERNYERWTAEGGRVDGEGLRERGERLWVWNPEIWWKGV